MTIANSSIDLARASFPVRLCWVFRFKSTPIQAMHQHDPHLTEMPIRRILLLNSVILSIGGIPQLYLGEEWGTINDYEFVRDPVKASDTRWVQGPRMNWGLAQRCTAGVDGEKSHLRVDPAPDFVAKG
jgi:hypothetical protein